MAVFVVGNLRDKKGITLPLHQDTSAAFRAVGCNVYNDAILLTALTTAPMRATKTFSAAAKLVRPHGLEFPLASMDSPFATSSRVSFSHPVSPVCCSPTYSSQPAFQVNTHQNVTVFVNSNSFTPQDARNMGIRPNQDSQGSQGSQEY